MVFRNFRRMLVMAFHTAGYAASPVVVVVEYVVLFSGVVDLRPRVGPRCWVAPQLDWRVVSPALFALSGNALAFFDIRRNLVDLMRKV